MGTPGIFAALAGSPSRWLGASPDPTSPMLSLHRAVERRPGALGCEQLLTCHRNVLCFHMLHLFPLGVGNELGKILGVCSAER